jgi:hypothetical protein
LTTFGILQVIDNLIEESIMRITGKQLRQIIREEIIRERMSSGLMNFDIPSSPPEEPPPPQDDAPRRGGRGPIMALYYTSIEANTGGTGMGENFERLLKMMNDELFGGHLSIRFGSGYDTYMGQTSSYVGKGESHYDETMDAIAVVGPLEDLRALVVAVEEELISDWGPNEPHPDHEIVPLSEPE